MMACRALLTAVLLNPCLLAWADHVQTSGDFQISVRVVPRVGAFSADQFSEALDKNCILRTTAAGKGWASYTGLLHKESAPLAYERRPPFAGSELGQTVPDWDILASGTSNSCGYRARRVVLSVTRKGTALDVCKFKLPPQVSVSRLSEEGSCTFYAIVGSNQSIPFTIDTGETVLTGAIPEDVLIASLGDSFASGEGNPDVPNGVLEQPLWMDTRCHRSVYASSIRAGLRILGSSEQITHRRYRRAIEAGAMTVMNFACSGALVAEGLNGTYQGVIGRTEALKLDPFQSEPIPEQFKTQLPLEPQITQLEKLLANQGPAGKKSVDLLLLSGGGNDVLFGYIVGTFVLQSVDEEKRKFIDKELTERFNRLDTDYDTMLGRLRSIDSVTSLKHIIAVRYPDSTYSSAGESCTGTLEQSSRLPAFFKWMKSLVRMTPYFKLSTDETKFVRERVMDKLDDFFSKRVQAQWGAILPQLLVMDANTFDKHDVRDHGWCTSGGIEAFAKQQRWFRSPYDSHAIQGNLSGAFHPTYQFNDQLAGAKIARLFIDSVNAIPDWEQLEITPLHEQSGNWYAPKKVRIALNGKASNRSRVRRQGSAEFSCIAGTQGCDSPTSELPLGEHGTIHTLVGEAEGGPARRPSNHVLRTVKVDDQAPRILCYSGDIERECANTQWVRDDRLTIKILDPQSGIRRAVVRFQNDPAALELKRISEHELIGEVHLVADGRYQLSVCAEDYVGNASGNPDSCAQGFTIMLDRDAPRVRSITMYGETWVSDPSHGMPAVPLFGQLGIGQSLKVNLHTKIAGFPCINSNGCQYPIPVATFSPWTRQSFELALKDDADNTATFKYVAVQLPDALPKKQPRSRDKWKSLERSIDMLRGLRATLTLEPRLLRAVDLSNPVLDLARERVVVGTTESDVELDAARTLFRKLMHLPVLMDWLNLVHGLQSPTQLTAINAVNACHPLVRGKPPRPMDRLRALRERSACLVATDGLLAQRSP